MELYLYLIDFRKETYKNTTYFKLTFFNEKLENIFISTFNIEKLQYLKFDGDYKILVELEKDLKKEIDNLNKKLYNESVGGCNV